MGTVRPVISVFGRGKPPRSQVPGRFDAALVMLFCRCLNQLDTLLDCQKPRKTSSDMHDEHLLIVTHQGDKSHSSTCTQLTHHYRRRIILTDHLSGPGRANGPLCVCGVCVSALLNQMAVDPGIWQAGSTWLYTSQLRGSRSYVKVHGHMMKKCPLLVMDTVHWFKSESKVEKTSYGAVRDNAGANDVLTSVAYRYTS